MKPDLPPTCFTWLAALAFLTLAVVTAMELRKAREKPRLQPWGLHYECPLDPDNNNGADEGDTQSHYLWSTGDSLECIRWRELKTSMEEITAHADPHGSRVYTGCPLPACFWLQVGPTKQDAEGSESLLCNVAVGWGQRGRPLSWLDCVRLSERVLVKCAGPRVRSPASIPNC